MHSVHMKLILTVLFSLSYGKSVASLIFRMACMTFYPDDGYFVLVVFLEKFIPKIRIESRVFFIAHPVVFLPFFSPSQLQCVANILRIAVKCYLAGFLEHFKGS